MGAEDALFQRFGRGFPRGEVLFREGDGGSEMFVIRAGRVAISKAGAEVEKVLVTLGAGEFFGELSILNGKPRTATATVVEDAQLLVIDPRTFEAMIRGSAEIAVRLIKKLADRLAEADSQIENLLLKDATSRLVHYLAHAAGSRGKPSPGGLRVALPIADLPTELGLAPQALKDAMQRVVRAGLASFQVDGFVVPDPVLLEEFQRTLESERLNMERG